MRIIALALTLLVLPAATSAAARSSLPGCEMFLERLKTAAGDLGVESSRALIVSQSRSDRVVFDIATKGEVDATLSCQGDEFTRLEARIAEPAGGRAATNFERFLSAALRTALNWDAGKSRGMVRSMDSDVRDYLRASKERGDVYISGKTEEHVAGGIGLGLIATDADRSFVIVAPGS